MPVKVRHRQLRNELDILWDDYYHNYNKDKWEPLKVWDIAELYNSNTGVEVWQATLELDEAIDAVKKHPNIFRWVISDKNTEVFSKKALQEYLNTEIRENQTAEAKYYNSNYNRFRRFLNKKPVLKTITYAIKQASRYSIKAFIGIWKYLVAISLVYLGVGDHLEKVYNFLKSIFIK